MLKEKLTSFVQEKSDLVEVEVVEAKQLRSEFELRFDKPKYYITYYLCGYTVKKIKRLV